MGSAVLWTEVNWNQARSWLFSLSLSAGQDSALLHSFLQHLLTDVHSWPPHGRDPSPGSLPRSWAISWGHAGAEPWTISWISPQHDGPEPRASFLRSPHATSGTLRVPSREHASDAQGKNQQSFSLTRVCKQSFWLFLLHIYGTMFCYILKLQINMSLCQHFKLWTPCSSSSCTSQKK